MNARAGQILCVPTFKFNEIENSFEFYISRSNICVKLEKKKFAECYVEVLKFLNKK